MDTNCDMPVQTSRSAETLTTSLCTTSAQEGCLEDLTYLITQEPSEACMSADKSVRAFLAVAFRLIKEVDRPEVQKVEYHISSTSMRNEKSRLVHMTGLCSSP